MNFQQQQESYFRARVARQFSIAIHVRVSYSRKLPCDRNLSGTPRLFPPPLWSAFPYPPCPYERGKKSHLHNAIFTSSLSLAACLKISELSDLCNSFGLEGSLVIPCYNAMPNVVFNLKKETAIIRNLTRKRRSSSSAKSPIYHQIPTLNIFLLKDETLANRYFLD